MQDYNVTNLRNLDSLFRVTRLHRLGTKMQTRRNGRYEQDGVVVIR